MITINTCPFCPKTFESLHSLSVHIGMEHKGIRKKKTAMPNITINIPEIYDKNIQKLIKMKIIPSRSEAVRTALREYLNKEYNKNLEILGFFKNKKGDELL